MIGGHRQHQVESMKTRLPAMPSGLVNNLPWHHIHLHLIMDRWRSSTKTCEGCIICNACKIAYYMHIISDEGRVKYFIMFCQGVLKALLHFDWQNVVRVNSERTRLMNVELGWVEVQWQRQGGGGKRGKCSPKIIFCPPYFAPPPQFLIISVEIISCWEPWL